MSGVKFTDMGQQDAPEIRFPCEYPIKVMGVASSCFSEEVVTVFQRHAPEVDREQIKVRESRQGTYLSVTVVIQATGKEQLEQLFQDLKTVAGVKLVL